MGVKLFSEEVMTESFAKNENFMYFSFKYLAFFFSAARK